MTKVPAEREQAGRLPSWRRDPISALRDEMEDLMTRVFGETGESWLPGGRIGAVDLCETQEAIEIRMDVPGVKAKELQIQLSGNTLTISGQREEEREEPGRTYHRTERRLGKFSRSLTLPCEVQEDKVEARERNGVLTVVLPKAEAIRGRKIEVKG